MPAETIEALDPRSGECAIDCTAGLGGHARLIAERIGPEGRLLLLDVDPGNLERAAASIRSMPNAPRVATAHGSFALVEAIVQREGLRADVVLADLGVASNQLDDPTRGLAFSHDGPLDMRLDPTAVGTAADLVNALPESRLADLIFELGEEPFARRIARRIAEARQRERIRTTAQLATLVREAYGSRAQASRMHPATRTFMALRIAVNDELGALGRLLDAVDRAVRAAAAGSPTWISPGARIAVISFHSLEDRLVKQAFKALSTRECPLAEATKKPLTASAEECSRNPRARSAKLRNLRLVGRC